jgi:hypothetical protein
MSHELNRPMRSLPQYLDELVADFNRRKMTDPKRGELAIRIREVEELIDARAAT